MACWQQRLQVLVQGCCCSLEGNTEQRCGVFCEEELQVLRSQQLMSRPPLQASKHCNTQYIQLIYKVSTSTNLPPKIWTTQLTVQSLPDHTSNGMTAFTRVRF